VSLRDGHGRAVSSIRPFFSSSDVDTYRIIREATAKSKDGRIDQSDFLNHSASSSRYSLFTPMEASIIFHFAGRGLASQRLALIDFAQLLDPRWKAPHDEFEAQTSSVSASFRQSFLHSAYSFVQGGMSIQ
jgi:solute carrier family 25 (mitochondrial aspartate/glutamate transporter), member 12/13